MRLARITCALLLFTQGMNPSRSLASEFPPAFSEPGRDKPFFDHHNFAAYCFDTSSCGTYYGGRFYESRTKPSSPAIDFDVRKLHTSIIGTENFPPPAVVRWVTKDGSLLVASVDMAALFPDQRVRHRVPEERLALGAYYMDPDIFLVVVDRTVSVYMKAAVMTGTPARVGGAYSSTAWDAVLVHSKTY